MYSCVHIYLSKPENVPVSDEWVLGHTERSQANHFKFRQDRVLYTAAHIFLRQSLSRHANITADQWRFTSNQYGKPSIVNLNGSFLHFNLSHTTGLLACAISAQFPVGIDVERHKPLPDFIGLCRSVFTQTEIAEILATSPPQIREQRFFTYWTLKEAYVKARGMGLSLPLQQFGFRQASNKRWFVQEGEQTLPDWFFLSQNITSCHSLAVAIQCGETIPTFMSTWLYEDYPQPCYADV